MRAGRLGGAGLQLFAKHYQVCVSVCERGESCSPSCPPLGKANPSLPPTSMHFAFLSCSTFSPGQVAFVQGAMEASVPCLDTAALLYQTQQCLALRAPHMSSSCCSCSPPPPCVYVHVSPQVSSMWEDYCSQMLLIRSIFLYLDRTYVMTLPGLRSLVDTGLVSLRQHLAAHPKVRQCALVSGRAGDCAGDAGGGGCLVGENQACWLGKNQDSVCWGRGGGKLTCRIVLGEVVKRYGWLPWGKTRLVMAARG